MTFENYTVGQVIEMQRTRLYAVGRYQFIPTTLRFAVAHSDVDKLDMFTPDVQDRLMAALIVYKRPAVGAYLRGDHDLEGWALNELAKEWASIEYRNGRGFYDHIGGNRAHITRAEVSAVLQKIKTSWQNS
jgi:muramidase (phage lysozyme)